jgi:hypothetical protein
MTPYRLCFPDEATAKQVLVDYHIQTEEGEQWHIASHEHNLVIVGDLYNNDATYNEAEEVIKPATKIEGFHVNLKAVSIPTAVIAYRREPKNTKVKWSGE